MGEVGAGVDPDEFFVLSVFCDTRPVQALTDWLDLRDPSFWPMLLECVTPGPAGG